ncbi:MAG: caspase family protein, partial [Chitinivibrionales bacterium]|nr:caspase family protein [Chitinivibrionales bacterium]
MSKMFIHFMRFFVMLVIFGSTGAFGQRFGLIIGDNNGGEGVEPLRYSHSDAQQVYTLLTSSAGFSPQQLCLLQEPKASQIDSFFIVLKNRSVENSFFMFYY